MIFTSLPLEGSYIIKPEPFSDDRGWFMRTYCKHEFEKIGHKSEWVQMNHSFTSKKGTIRGMHYQLPPHGEIKLVRCVSGEVYDVIIDLRKDSPTFLKYFGTKLSAANKEMIYIPAGFAHGFQTLTDNAELVYNHSAFYTPASEASIRYNDEAVSIVWPLALSDISAKDANAPLTDKNFKGI
jgi:dTDP-4-dehydrorhamnose 3,5-epimerase